MNVVILEKLGVFLNSESEPLDEGEQARSSVLDLLPDNLGQFVRAVKTVHILRISLHQRIRAGREEHLKSRYCHRQVGGRRTGGR